MAKIRSDRCTDRYFILFFALSDIDGTNHHSYHLEIPVSDFYTAGQTAYEVRVLHENQVVDYRRFTVE